MAELSERPSRGRHVAPPGLAGVFPLIGQAFGQVGHKVLPAVALALTSAGVTQGSRLVRRALDIPTNLPGLSPTNLAVMVCGALAASVVAALTLRLFLETGPRWWRPDRGFAVAVGLLTLASLGFSALTLLTMGRLEVGPSGNLPLREGLLFTEFMVVGWIYARLLLWPIGALAGDQAMTPGRSWARMKGYVASYIGVVVVLGLPGAILPAIGVVLRLTNATELRDQMQVLVGVLGPIAALLEHAVAANLYRSRSEAAAMS
jgi:hypothetical protein